MINKTRRQYNCPYLDEKKTNNSNKMNVPDDEGECEDGGHLEVHHRPHGALRVGSEHGEEAQADGDGAEGGQHEPCRRVSQEHRAVHLFIFGEGPSVGVESLGGASGVAVRREL
jgi:hypothetical protein